MFVGLLVLWFLSLAEAFSSLTSHSMCSTLLYATPPEKQHVIRKFGGDSRIACLHQKRIRTAGRVGSKSYENPCKVFVGNLPTSIDGDGLAEFVLSKMGQSSVALASAKVICEWKTGKSKGYGFVVFTDPIFATVCIETIHGKRLGGKTVTVAQGRSKPVERKRRPKVGSKTEERGPTQDEDDSDAVPCQQATGFGEPSEPEHNEDSFTKDSSETGNLHTGMNRKQRRQAKYGYKPARKQWWENLK